MIYQKVQIIVFNKLLYIFNLVNMSSLTYLLKYQTCTYNLYIYSKFYMSDTYITLAKQLLEKNTPECYQKFQALLLDSSNIERILESVKYSNQLLFATCEILSKAILKGEFLSVEQTRSDDGGDFEKSIQLQRIRVYSMIMVKIYPLASSEVSAHIQRSCLNLVSVCLKCILEKCVSTKLTPQTIQQYFGIVLPGFMVNESFINNFNTEIVILKANDYSLPQNFQKAIKVLVYMMQYITINAYYKTYYDFRRNIYTVRNTGLPYILNISIYYLKCLFNYWENARGNIDQYLARNMSLILQLLDSVMMFPFTLSLHEYDHQAEGNEVSSGYTSEIYFPSYFRNILCDTYLITYIVKYYSVLMSKYNTGNTAQSKFILQDLKKLVRIIGRYLNANSYCFNTDLQRINFRSHCLLQAITLATQCKSDDPYLISFISQVLQKIMCSYTSSDYGGRKSEYLKICFIFAHNLINTKIILFDGKKNPFNLGFELIGLCINETEDTPDQSNAKQAAQTILQEAMKRISDNKETEQIFKQFNNPTMQIQCFEELFSSISAIFNAQFQKNLTLMAEIDFQTINQYSHRVWLHFASSVLPNHRANNQHTKVILKFFELAKAYSNIAGLHYLHVVTEQLLTNMQQGTSQTSLWNNIQQITNENFSPFVRFILKRCCASFTIPDNALLDYSLQIIKSIYSKLKKYNKPQFDSLYEIIQQVLNNMNATVFVQPKFFKKRTIFFNVVSVIYLNGSQIKYVYQIYNIIYEQYKTNQSPLNFLKFMNDITGILQGIEIFENFNIFCQIALKDLSVLIPKYLNPSSIQELFSEAAFLKGFLKLALALSNDSCRRYLTEIHNKTGLLIYQLFYPYLCQAIKYDFPKIIVQVWYKFIPLDCSAEILPISSQFKTLDSNFFSQMLREYFNQIHRIQNLQILYPFIEDNVEFMIDWWDEVMTRGLKPQINMKDVAEARIWSSKRQKQNFARLLFYLGKYDEQYWRIPSGIVERDFVNNFVEKFT